MANVLEVLVGTTVGQHRVMFIALIRSGDVRRPGNNDRVIDPRSTLCGENVIIAIFFVHMRTFEEISSCGTVVDADWIPGGQVDSLQIQA